MMNPIISRELVESLRTRKMLAAQLALALACSLLVLVRWPTSGVSDLTGARSLQVLRVFGYGLLAGIVFVVPAFPATAIVRERVKGTLALLLNSPLTPTSIYFGKFFGSLGTIAVLLLMTIPAGAACYALGGGSAKGGVGLLYLVLIVAGIQFAALGLFISCRAQSPDSALRTTYGLVLALCLLPMAPHLFFRGDTGALADAASLLRCISPVPAVMEILGHGDVGSRGMDLGATTVVPYLVLALLMSAGCAGLTIWRLMRSPLDVARAAGTMTEDRSDGERVARRLFFLIDPQRRSRNMGLLANPVMVKEFRTRRFGRSHWTIRLLALTAVLSLGISYIAASGALGWGPELIGGALVLLQASLLILITPSLSAGLVSAEREGGGWQLLRMTPVAPGKILRGKLVSVLWPILLLMSATLPGYIVMMTVKPELAAQIQRVLISLGMIALFAVFAGATASSFFRSTAAATALANLIVVGVCILPLLAWLGRDAPFGHGTVEAILSISPVAAALHAAETPGFTEYELLPLNWWLMGGVDVLLAIVLYIRTRQLCRPE